MKILPLLSKDARMSELKGKWLTDMFGRFHFGEPDEAIFQQYDLGISFLYPHILNRKHLKGFTHGVINIHPSMLPFGRGAMPNVWTIIDMVPGGVTFHWMDEGIDTGDIIHQVSADPHDWETGEDYYWRLLGIAHDEFQKVWYEKKAKWGWNEGKKIPEGLPQAEMEEVVSAVTHKTTDVKTIDDLEESFGKQQIWDILNVLRARTFSGHESAYVKDKYSGKKIYVKVQLELES